MAEVEAKTTPKKRKRQTVPITLWIKAPVRTELERLAKFHDLSLSKYGGTLLEATLRQEVYNQQQTLSSPIFEKLIRKEMRRRDFMHIHNAFSGEYNRSILVNILGILLEEKPDRFNEILSSSTERAKKNMLRKTPQLQTVLNEIEQWLKEEAEEPHEKKT